MAEFLTLDPEAAIAEIQSLRERLAIEEQRGNAWRAGFNCDTDLISELRGALRDMLDTCGAHFEDTLSYRDVPEHFDAIERAKKALSMPTQF